jgi:hypothetical protein
MLTTQQMKENLQKGIQSGTVKPTTTSSNAGSLKGQAAVDYLNSYTPKAPANQNIFQKVGLGSVDNMAGEISAGIGGGMMANDQNKAVSSMTNTTTKVLEQAKILADQGKTKEATELLNTHMKSQDSLRQRTGVGEIAKSYEHINDTPEQVIGNVAGTVGLATGNPAVAGGLVMGGNAMNENKGVAEVLTNSALGTIGGALIGKVLEVGFKAASPMIESAITKYGTPMFEKLSAHIPDGMKAGYKALADNASGLSKGIDKTLTNFADKTGISKVQGVIDAGVQNTKNIIGDATNKVKSGVTDLVKGKAETKILSTLPEDVYKLKPTERKAWFDNEQTKINTQSEATTNQIKQNLVQQSQVSKEIDTQLQKELSTASRDKVIELRPKIIKSMGEQSKIYRSLIDEEMAGKEAIPVDIKELSSHIDTMYGDNPGMAEAIKGRLGIGKNINESSTIGDIYNQTKSLKQDIGTAATKGTRVFTPDEKLTDDAISTLTGFMKNKGVDFREANKFWSEYAPVRNQLVSEANPFNAVGTQTKQFATTLENVARGKDVNNENFIGQVEDLLGEPIIKENKTLVQALDTNKKTLLANKIESESKLIDAQMTKDKSLAKLSSEQFEVERSARLRDAVRSSIKWIIGLTALGGAEKTLHMTTGIGF